MKHLSVMFVFLLYLRVHAGLIFAQEEKIKFLSLQDALSIAFENNPELKAEREKINITKANLTLARTIKFNPTLSAGLNNVFSTEEQKAIGLFKEIEQGISLEREIERKGKKKQRFLNALTDVEITKSEINDKERVLITEVKKGFFEASFFKAKLALLNEIKDLNQNLVDIAHKKLQAGEIPELEYNLNLLELKKSETEVEKLKGDYGNAKIKLSALLGLDPTTFEMQENTTIEKLDSTLEELKLLAMENRPDLKVFENQKNRMHGEVLFLKQDRKPNMTYHLGLTKENDKTYGTVGVSFPLVIYNKNQGEIEEFSAREKTVAAQTEALKIQIDGEVAAAYVRLKSLEQSLSSYETDILRLLEENLSLVQKGYQAGEVSIVEVLQVKDKFIQIKKDYLETLFAYENAVADMERAAGKTSLTQKGK